MIVVSDTSPITALLQIHRIELLAALVGYVIIPPAVDNELRRSHTDIPAFIRVHAIKETSSLSDMIAAMDRGEAEAILLAEQLHADLVLMDEKLGRRVAVEHGLRGSSACSGFWYSPKSVAWLSLSPR